MITYKNVGIQIREAQKIDEGDFVVSRTDGLVFAAASVYGSSYARTAEEALDGAKKLIDRAGSR